MRINVSIPTEATAYKTPTNRQNSWRVALVIVFSTDLLDDYPRMMED
jgi:hypothetical protein